MNTVLSRASAPRFITVEGNIGSGKSTFLKKLHATFNLPAVLEPHALWQNINGHNLLQEFYSNTTRWSYSFQTYAFLTRSKVLQEELQKHVGNDVFVIAERSVLADKFCFARACCALGTMSELEWNMYSSWHTWFLDTYLEKPAGIIYLRVDPQISHERVQIRSRGEEAAVSIEYLQLLHDYHEQWLIEKKNLTPSIQEIPVLTLDGNDDFEHNSTNWDNLCVQIQNFKDDLWKSL